MFCLLSVVLLAPLSRSVSLFQDFPSLTPNLLARTIETVEGGGVIVMLIKSMASLRQLYTMSMDVHARFRTESHQDVVGRFNERFLLSLAQAENTLVVDDELNILPLSSSIRNISKVQPQLDENGEQVKDPLEVELSELKDSLRDTPPVGNLIDCTRTLDQAKAVLSFMESVSEKTLRSTVVLTAGRGRGKSAALGLSIAGAVAFGYSNIFVTAPSPENLKTLFEMIFKGFDAFQYKEHADYEVVQSTNPEFNNAIVRVNIFHTHRQTIQYIQPNDYAKLGQAELLVIDEAAAIPLPLVKSLLGPYLVFMSSTINGYEGTGRSLSLKLVKQLRAQSTGAAAAAAAPAAASSSSAASALSTGRSLREVSLDEPIRYARNDPIESWLNRLLCLDCTSQVPRLLGSALPHPSSCELYYVERDTLFSSHKASEAFLQRMMSLYVSSHYKNSPNDLQLMSDAPAHHLFVLLGPVSSTNTMPDILAVIQVCLEGSISRESVLKALARGERASGDLIPWCISQQYQNQEFASLNGARIVRIATNPEVARFGYGSRAIELLAAYYEGKITNLSEGAAAAAAATAGSKAKAAKAKVASSSSSSNGSAPMDEDGEGEKDEEEDGEEIDTSNLLSEVLAPRKSLPPLLTSLQDRAPEPLHYLGVSYGLTQELFNFWSKAHFTPLYLRLTANELTGEHTCIMLRNLHESSNSALETLTHAHWLEAFHTDFLSRFQHLLAFNFSKFSASLALSMLVDPNNSVLENGGDASKSAAPSASSSSSSQAVSPWIQSSSSAITLGELQHLLTSFDLRRLESYSNNLVDYHMILDLIPVVAALFFKRRFGPAVKLSYTQAAILLALGLQHKDVGDIERELGLPQSQVLAQFNKSVRKIVQRLKDIEHEAVKKEVEVEQGEQAKAVKAKAEAAAPAAAAAGSAVVPASDKKAAKNQPLNQSLDSELDASGNAAVAEMKRKQRELLDGLNLEQYAIGGSETEWAGALTSAAATPGSTVSVASSDKKKEQHREYLKNKADGAQKRALGASDKGQGSAKKKKH
jgi:N-acetyltransferase 10